MNTYPYSKEKNFFVASVNTTTGVHAHDITPFQLSLVDAASYLSVNTITDKAILVIGSAHNAQNVIGGNLKNLGNPYSYEANYHSVPFTNSSIVALSHDKPVTQTTQSVYYLGYDGVNVCNGLQFECGKTYNVIVNLFGQPTEQLGGTPELQQYYTVVTDDCSKCVGGCLTTDNKVKYLNTLVDQINNNAVIVNRLIKAQAVIHYCAAPPTITQIGYTQYSMTVCDDGSALSLAKIKQVYGNSIKKLSRLGSFSTYMTDFTLTSAGAPAAYVTTDTVLANCAVCPAGSTTVPAYKQYKISIDNTGSGTNAAAWLAEVQSLYSTAVKADRIDFSFGTSSYLVNFPIAFVEPTTVPADSTFSYLGNSDMYCVLPSATYSWSVVDTAYKIVRTLHTTIQNPNCTPDTTLADMQAFYLNRTDIVAGSIIIPSAPVSDGCKTVYEIQQYSNILKDGCDWVAVASFGRLAGYANNSWAVDVCQGWTLTTGGCPIPPTVVNNEAVLGIRFETSFFQSLPEYPAYGLYDQLNKEPVILFASFNETYTIDGTNLNSTAPFRQAVWAQRETMNGLSVLKSIVQTEKSNSREFYNMNYRMVAAMGLQYGLDPKKFYGCVKMVADNDSRVSFLDSSTYRTTYAFFYEINDKVTEQALISFVNKLAAKTTVKLIA